uniref:Uncharacterized protein n=1 Tax=Rhizophora mucronata TaxID=61149 RepID=A0A2P2NQP9_RHIMU
MYCNNSMVLRSYLTPENNIDFHLLSIENIKEMGLKIALPLKHVLLQMIIFLVACDLRPCMILHVWISVL